MPIVIPVKTSNLPDVVDTTLQIPANPVVVPALGITFPNPNVPPLVVLVNGKVNVRVVIVDATVGTMEPQIIT